MGSHLMGRAKLIEFSSSVPTKASFFGEYLIVVSTLRAKLSQLVSTLSGDFDDAIVPVRILRDHQHFGGGL